jgi:segregation and condensation protein B
MIEIEHLRLIEALLFASPNPLPAKALADRLPKEADIAAILAQLQADYAPRGVNLMQRDGTWAFRTAPDLATSLHVESQVARKLSRAALETLAIVAYHQPVTRGEIEEIRGVAVSKGTMDILFEAGWIRPKGRRRTPGRPLTWVTTPGFLDHFGLESLDELPGVDELKAAGLLDTRPAIAAYANRAGAPEALVDVDEREDGAEGST